MGEGEDESDNHEEYEDDEELRERYEREAEDLDYQHY